MQYDGVTQSGTLPPGSWYMIRNFPLGTTDQQVREWLHTCGIQITTDCISVRDFVSDFGSGGRTNAMISIPDQEMENVISWLITAREYPGASNKRGGGCGLEVERFKSRDHQQRTRDRELAYQRSRGKD